MDTSKHQDYLDEVKSVLEDRYEAFLQVMSDYRTGMINVNGVLSRLREIFKHHRNLMVGFYNFVPDSYRTPIDDDGVDQSEEHGFDDGCNMAEILRARKLAPPQDMRRSGSANCCGCAEKASDFFKKVWNALGNVDDHIKFLKLITMYRCGNINRYELEIWISKLFQNDADLIKEFDAFIGSFHDDYCCFRVGLGKNI